jgi:hypothetical protein
MKIKLTEGCICNSLEIDGVEEIDLTDEQREKILEKVCKEIKPKNLNHLLRYLVCEYAQEYHCDSEPCECCGDYVEEYVWTI